MRIQRVIPKPRGGPAEHVEITEPTNAWSHKRSAAYTKELHADMHEVVDSTREFFLREIFPTALSLTNGFADANEVLVTAIGDSSSATPLMGLVENFMIQAIRTRILIFVAKQFKLSKAEAKLYIISNLSKDGVNQGSLDDRVETLLREMQSLADMPRTRQSPDVQLQQLPEKPRGKLRQRVRADRADARPGPRRGEDEAEEVPKRKARRLRGFGGPSA